MRIGVAVARTGVLFYEKAFSSCIWNDFVD